MNIFSRRYWRRKFRSPFIVDLRQIVPEHRHLYRRSFEGDCASAIGGLANAYCAGHMKSQRT